MTLKGCIILTNQLFALDIGTRSVVGIILKEQDGNFHVEDLMTIEHKERSMIDGQIHNVLSVAKVISEMKTRLEEKHGELKQVSVAAAGRALKTAEGTMTIDISDKSLFSTEDINHLELAAVQQAQQKLLSASNTADDYYYCVGYSVLHYKLDGDEIGNLIDQTGRTATVDVIATFLPRVVVESLLSALKRANLEMEALTLEPIAAINVLIPPSMRRLNVALVDIGAGTSDIAITAQNTVVAYGMVPIAGDEVTEALSNHYLLDFPIAETVKRSLNTKEEIVLTDILGFENRIPSAEVIASIQPSIDKLASNIAEEILRLNNGESPQAVMVVGGGSLTPQLPNILSEKLNLPQNRVAIRGLDALTEVTLSESISSSPALVTPIGIAIAAKRAPIHYMSVTVNDKTIRLFELKEMTVGDALLAANVKARQLYGKPGLGMTISINGRQITIPGEHGKPSIIYLNGKQASIKDLIKTGDIIHLTAGVDGKDASATVQEIIGDDMDPIHIHLNGEEMMIKPEILLNGIAANRETIVKDRDEILFKRKTEISELIGNSNVPMNHPFHVVHNGKKINLPTLGPFFAVREKIVPPTYKIQDGDEITFTTSLPSVKDVLNALHFPAVSKIEVTFNGEPVSLEMNRRTILLNGKPASEKDEVNVGDRIDVSETNDPLCFSDIFAYIDYTLPKTAATTYQLLRNGSPIGFNDPIYPGDELQIKL
ncbi:cell division protein FtsA [Sporosarcina contaminans]|uniref:Cell division protein FtsA n=1 Tax=Sporosarcina contaminans TaxID=633403 RepID=A0ABW3U4P1_9BACL